MTTSTLEACPATTPNRRTPLVPPLLALLLALVLLPGPPGAAASAKHTRRKLALREGPTSRTIEERGLLDPGVSAADLAEGAREYSAAAARRRFGGHVLGYVTPWCERVRLVTPVHPTHPT
jgi:hypothetical protein